MTPEDLQIIRDARFHHSCMVAQRDGMRNSMSIHKNRFRCANLRAIVRMMRNERKAQK